MKRKRKYVSAAHAAQARELAASWEKLIAKYQPKQSPGRAGDDEEVQLTAVRAMPIRALPPKPRSHNGGVDPAPVAKVMPRYEGKMLERELAAKEEYERKKLRVAPPGNKMGAQYLSDSECEAFRAGELRRR